MSAYQGDVISILGSSGSGKSTFLRCINFLDIPSRGTYQGTCSGSGRVL